MLIAASLPAAAWADGLQPHLIGPEMTGSALPGAAEGGGRTDRVAPAAHRRPAVARRLSGLDDAQALTVARHTFPDVLNAPAVRPLRLALGQRVTRYLGARGAVVAGAGSRTRSLVESILPLRADGSAPTSFELEAVANGLRTRNAPVPVTLGTGQGTSLSFADFSLTVAGAQAAGPREIGGARLVWANALRDADLVLAPHPVGATVDAVLRSATSPESFDLALGGDDVAATAAGADATAIVTKDGAPVGRILNPIAFDAAGRAVPTHAQVLANGRVRIVVEHRAAHPTYPVYVDPVVEGAVLDDDLSATAGGWTFGTSVGGAFSGSVGTGVFGNGQYQDSQASTTYADGDLSRWRYQAPGTSFVYRVDVDSVSFTPATGAGGGSCLTMGIDTGSGWETGGTGPYSTCAALSTDTRSLCAATACAQDGTPGSSATIEQAMDGAGARTTASTAFVGGATVYLSDDDAPTLGSGAAPTAWRRTGLVTWDAVAHDTGLGVASISWNAPASQSGEAPVGCTGLADDRCPAGHTGGVSVDAGLLPEGINAITLKAYDVVGHDSAPLATSVKVDRTGPEVGLNGSLASLDGRTVATDVGLQVGAVDGTAGVPRSGVASIDILVDGVTKDHIEQTCTVGSCSMSRNWTLVPSAYSVGSHTVRVEVTDVAGNVTARTIVVNIGSGRITSLSEGERTSRRVMLAAEGYHEQTGVTFQWRNDASGSWADVPLTTVRKDDGSAISSWPVSLDDHKSPLLAWDLVGSATQPGMISSGLLANDGPVQVRAVFSGGDAGVSQEVWTTLDRAGVSARNATASIGPGSVDLVTGNFSMSMTDVSIETFNSDLTIQRVYNSRREDSGISLGENWSLSVPNATASSEFQSLVNLAQIPDPDTGETSPYVLLLGSEGEEVVFSESATGYTPDAGYENYKLTRVMSSTNPGVISRFELKNTQSGETSIFEGHGGGYRLTGITLGGDNNSVSYEYNSMGKLEAIIAPHPGTATCTVSTFGRGCKGLFFNYAVGWGQRVQSIDYRAWDPATSAVKTTTRVTYEYMARGEYVLLKSVSHPQRTGGTYSAQYNYNNDRQLTDIWPNGEDNWAFAWNAGRLKAVGRTRNFSGPNSTWSVRYDVPRTGGSAPHPMGASDVAAWGQDVVPLDATALFRPDDVPSDPVSSYAKAEVHYLDGYGRDVNIARAGGRIETTERDRAGNVARALTAGNRERALASGSTSQDHADKAVTLDTQSTYDQDGLRLLEQLGPEHDVRLPDGSDVRARKHVVNSYDQGAPSTGGPFNLLTRQTEGAVVSGTSSDEDVRTTEFEYDWTLRKQTKAIVDPSGLALTTGTVHDSTLGVPVERRMPRSPSGGDASATRSIYYTAATNSEDSACSNRPEWAGQVCRTKPVAQPGTSGLPELPTETFEYSYLNQVVKTTEHVGGDTKVRTLERDTQGRVTSDETTGTSGAATPKVQYGYAGTFSGSRTRAELVDGSKRYIFYTNPNYWGQLETAQNYRDDGSGASALSRHFRYDANGRLSSLDQFGLSPQLTYSYDPITAELTSISPAVPWNGLNFGTISATYDADGKVKSQTFALGNVTRTTTRDETGTPVRVTYVKTVGCSSDCTWLDSQDVFDIHGQRVAQSGDRSSQALTYDAAARLERTADDVDGHGCTTRTYGFDANSNRVSLTTHPPDSGGACSTSTTATTATHSYDAADRLKDSGVGYDPFGRIVALPPSAAGGAALDMGYYTNDAAKSYTQGGRTTSITLDPLMRPMRRLTTGRTTESLFYDDDTDQPYKAVVGDTTNTFITGIDGQLDVDFVNRNGTDKPMLQLRNLHNDIVGEALLNAGTAQPSARWETDEYGVPREPPKPIETVGATSAATVALSSGVTLDKPSGVKAGDLLVAVLSAPSGKFIDKPSGWTQIGTGNNGSGYIAYHHVAGASEPSSYTFPATSTLLRGGLVALRGVDQVTPILSFAYTSGTTVNATLPAATPTVDDAALVQVVGADAGDTDGGASWAFSSDLTPQWDLTTGTSSAADRTMAGAVRVLVNNRQISVPSSTVANALGSSSAVAWSGITIAIAPKRGPLQQRYGYLGGLERPVELPSGIIGMGARVYVPQLGRFLQTDPISGGSANTYDYANQDPLNQADPSGLMPNPVKVIFGMGKCNRNLDKLRRLVRRMRALYDRANARASEGRGRFFSENFIVTVLKNSQEYHEAMEACGSVGQEMIVGSARMAR